jgi:hypothetical protein
MGNKVIKKSVYAFCILPFLFCLHMSPYTILLSTSFFEAHLCLQVSFFLAMARQFIPSFFSLLHFLFVRFSWRQDLAMDRSLFYLVKLDMTGDDFLSVYVMRKLVSPFDEPKSLI